jgi:hypothetical protein
VLHNIRQSAKSIQQHKELKKNRRYNETAPQDRTIQTLILPTPHHLQRLQNIKQRYLSSTYLCTRPHTPINTNYKIPYNDNNTKTDNLSTTAPSVYVDVYINIAIHGGKHKTWSPSQQHPSTKTSKHNIQAQQHPSTTTSKHNNIQAQQHPSTTTQRRQRTLTTGITRPRNHASIRSITQPDLPQHAM